MDGATPLFTPASHDRSFKILIAFLQIHRVEPLLFQAVSAGVSGCYSGNKSCCSIWLFVSCPDLTSFEAATVRLRPPRRFLEIVKRGNQLPISEWACPRFTEQPQPIFKHKPDRGDLGSE